MTKDTGVREQNLHGVAVPDEVVARAARVHVLVVTDSAQDVERVLRPGKGHGSRVIFRPGPRPALQSAA